MLGDDNKNTALPIDVFQKTKDVLAGSFQVAVDDTALICPAYYLMTGRKKCSYRAGFGAVQIIAAHPNLDNTILVFPELGHGNGLLTVSTLQELAASGARVMLARTTKEQVQDINSILMDVGKLSPIYHIELVKENVMDWAYPVQIVSTEKVTTKTGTAFRNFRSDLRKIEGQVTSEVVGSKQTKLDIKTIQHQWAAVQYQNNKAEPNQDLISFYEHMNKVFESHPKELQGLVFYQNAQPVAYNVWALTTDRQHAVGIANPQTNYAPGLSAFVMYATCQFLRDNGVETLNIGGSETENQHFFKKNRYVPVKSLPVRSAHVHYKEPHISSGALVGNSIPKF